MLGWNIKGCEFPEVVSFAYWTQFLEAKIWSQQSYTMPHPSGAYFEQMHGLLSGSECRPWQLQCLKYWGSWNKIMTVWSFFFSQWFFSFFLLVIPNGITKHVSQAEEVLLVSLDLELEEPVRRGWAAFTSTPLSFCQPCAAYIFTGKVCEVPAHIHASN